MKMSQERIRSIPGASQHVSTAVFTSFRLLDADKRRMVGSVSRCVCSITESVARRRNGCLAATNGFCVFVYLTIEE